MFLYYELLRGGRNVGHKGKQALLGTRKAVEDKCLLIQTLNICKNILHDRRLSFTTHVKRSERGVMK